MASPSAAKTTTFALPRLRDLTEHDDLVEEDGDEEEEEEEEEDWEMSKRMSRLSVEGSDGGDADDEDDGSGGGDDEDEDEDEDEMKSDVNCEYVSQPWHPCEDPRNRHVPSSASLPGTPERGAPAQSPWRYSKDYASETEAGWWPGAPHDKRRQRMMREVWLDRAWQMRKQRRQLGERGDEVTVVVGIGGGDSPARGGVAMDMEEVRACKDLGFDLPCDWTVEIPCYAISNVDTASSGGNSPASGSWRISCPVLTSLHQSSTDACMLRILRNRGRSQGREGQAQGVGAGSGAVICRAARFLIEGDNAISSGQQPKSTPPYAN